MALLLFAVAVAGFAPNTQVALSTGDHPPLLVQIHAALMLSWLLLLVMQASLKFFGRMDLHRQIGMSAFALLPVIVVAMVLASYGKLAADAELGPISPIRYNVLLLQFRAIVFFPLFVCWAQAIRRSSPASHKRFMIVATVVLLDAALARTSWLPGPGPGHPAFESMSIYQLLLLLPLVAHDLIGHRRLHRATIIGVGLFAISGVVVNLLWGSAWWHETAARLAERIL